MLFGIIKKNLLNKIMSNNYNFNSMMKTMLALVPFAASMASAATIVKRVTVDELMDMEKSDTAF